MPEFYPGTSKPKSYESQVTVFPESGGQYDAVIRMNEPLRLSGWTLYQMSWGQDSLHPGRLISILRASHNPLEQMPKWSSYIIAAGLHVALCLRLRKVPAPQTRPASRRSGGGGRPSGAARSRRQAPPCA